MPSPRSLIIDLSSSVVHLDIFFLAGGSAGWDFARCLLSTPDTEVVVRQGVLDSESKSLDSLSSHFCQGNVRCAEHIESSAQMDMEDRKMSGFDDMCLPVALRKLPALSL